MLYSPKTNPFNDYFIKVSPLWNEDKGGDYIQRFSEYIQVTDQKRCAFQFKKWLVRCVACALDKEYFNKQALIFVQETQHGGKTTLTRFLIPKDLTAYYTENISVNKDSLIALCQNFGVIQDELSTLSKVEINAQKTLMSRSYVKVRHPYDRKPKLEPRRASIWGCTNKDEFLADETGSVRWLCFNISIINFAYKNDIDINKVWSQAYCLYKTGFKYEMTSEEIQENEKANHQCLVQPGKVFQKLESHSQKSGTILQNQAELKGSLKSHSGLLTQIKQEISDLIKQQLAMRKSQKRLQVIWIITFLTIAIPLSAFWVAWLIYLMFR